MDFDKLVTQIGGMGRYQVVMYILIGLTGLQVGMNNLASVFLLASPDHHCHLPTHVANISRLTLKQLLIPDEVINEETVPSQCRIRNIQDFSRGYNGSRLNFTHIFDTFLFNGSVRNGSILPPAVFCNQWQYDRSLYESTIVTQSNLVCDASFKRALSASIYMCGFLLGAIVFGGLSDKYGRKPVLLLALAVMVVFGTCAAFTPEYWSFCFMRMVVGSGAAGTFTVGFVLIMEMMTPEHRMMPGILWQGWFAAGYILLSLLAYGIRNHIYLQLAISIPPIVFLVYFWIVSESPRWLIVERRTSEANVILNKMADWNRSEYSDKLLIKSEQYKENHEKTKKGTVLDLLKTPNMRKKTINICFNWFVNSLVYYGLSLGVADLVGSPYLNLCLSGLVEFPGFLFAILTMDRIGRRWSLSICLFAGGAACLACFPIPKHLWILKTVFSLVGKCFVSGSFAIIYVFSAELFPTVVRNVGVGTGSMCARVGGLLAPFIAMASLGWKPLPFIIFGTVSILAGLLTLLLPETLNQTLPQTIEDGERFGKRQNKDGAVLNGTVLAHLS